ncbi:MAG: hypothetical protein LRY66_17995 [Saccharospirillaceae bacterium]|nr:hypothetical protein [Saccharospirillaceae bacterium]MCD8533193.1 hypothetical protein [Saccharospirillaceae bacterium]
MTELLPLASLTLLVFTLLVFLRAALHKALDFLEFQGFVADYDLLPEALVKPVAAALLALEGALVLMLLFSASRAAGLVLAALLLGGYAIAMGINIRRGHTRIECGCGGTPQRLGKTLLLRNALLMVFALLPLLGLPEALQSAEVVVAIAAAVFMWLVFLLFEQVNANLLAIREMANSLKRI